MKHKITIRIGYRYAFYDKRNIPIVSQCGNCTMERIDSGAVFAVETIVGWIKSDLEKKHSELADNNNRLTIRVDSIAVEIAPFQMPEWWLIIAALLFMGGGAVVQVIVNALKAWGF